MGIKENLQRQLERVPDTVVNKDVPELNRHLTYKECCTVLDAVAEHYKTHPFSKRVGGDDAPCYYLHPTLRSECGEPARCAIGTLLSREQLEEVLNRKLNTSSANSMMQKLHITHFDLSIYGFPYRVDIELNRSFFGYMQAVHDTSAGPDAVRESKESLLRMYRRSEHLRYME